MLNLLSLNGLVTLGVRLFAGKVFSNLIKLLFMVPDTAESIEPKKDRFGKYITPFPEPNIGKLAVKVRKMIPNKYRETATEVEVKEFAYHLAKAYQYAKALFN